VNNSDSTRDGGGLLKHAFFGDLIVLFGDDEVFFCTETGEEKEVVMKSEKSGLTVFDDHEGSLILIGKSTVAVDMYEELEFD
jgi:hypothetical protein